MKGIEGTTLRVLSIEGTKDIEGTKGCKDVPV